MTTDTHITAPTRFVETNEIRYAYPDAGYGSQLQYPQLFVTYTRLFLDAA